MRSLKWHHAAPGGLGLVIGTAALFAISLVGIRLNINLASVGVLHLLVVVLVALYAGFWQASLVSLAAVGFLNYYFIPPVFSLEIADPQNWVSLATFECTAVVVSRLSHNVKVQAWAAEQRRHDVERLYEVCKQILRPDAGREYVGPRISELILHVFSLDGIVFFDASADTVCFAGSVPSNLESAAREAFRANRDHHDEPGNVWLQVVRIGGRAEGSLAMVSREMTGIVASALASLTALALEHGRSFEREAHAHAARQTEQLRTAVLDALAHEFKSPLTTIRTASSGLLERGRMTSTQRELVTLIDEETERLTQLTTSLLQTATLDSDAVTVRTRAVSVREIVESVIASMQLKLENRRLFVGRMDHADAVTADPELCRHALTQLLENAVRYSYPGSDIDVTACMAADEVVIAVKNQGTPIPLADQDRIFDRFYRSRAVERHDGGTGIGLSVAKNLIEAQAGRIWVESNETAGTVFYLALPAHVETCEGNV